MLLWGPGGGLPKRMVSMTRRLTISLSTQASLFTWFIFAHAECNIVCVCVCVWGGGGTLQKMDRSLSFHWEKKSRP